MWQPVTNHEEAWEYLQAGLLWFGIPPHRMEQYSTFPEWDIDKEAFLHKCEYMGTEDGFCDPHYIHVEE